jgi:hypothetical protein
MRPCTDAEHEMLQHVILTSDVDWDPRVLDLDIDDNNDWCGAISDDANHTDLFEAFGNHKGCMELDVSAANIWFDTVAPDQHTQIQMEEAAFMCSKHARRVQHFDNDDFNTVLLVDDTKLVETENPAKDDTNSDQDTSHTEPDIEDDNTADAPACTFKAQEPNCNKLRLLFGWMNTKTIKKTFETTAQCAPMPHGTILKKRHKSPFPALNMKRRDEPVATDTVFSDTPAIDGGETCAQIFVGAKLL